MKSKLIGNINSEIIDIKIDNNKNLLYSLSSDNII